MPENLAFTRSCQLLCRGILPILSCGEGFEMTSRVSTSSLLPSFRDATSIESMEQIQCLPGSEQGVWSWARSAIQFTHL